MRVTMHFSVRVFLDANLSGKFGLIPGSLTVFRGSFEVDRDMRICVLLKLSVSGVIMLNQVKTMGFHRSNQTSVGLVFW